DTLLATSEYGASTSDDGEIGTEAPESTPAQRRAMRYARIVALSADEQAERQATIARHLPLARYVANAMSRHTGQSVLLDYDDLLSYGTEGLITAVDTFDAGRGLKFSTWAVMHIRTTIQDALRSLDPLPRSIRARGREIEKVSAALAQQNGAWPDAATIAGELGQPLEQVRRTLA